MRFDQARPFATLGIAAAVWLLLPVAFKAVMRASFFELTAPVTVAASKMRDLRQFWSFRLHSDRELIEAGVELARANSALEVAAQQNFALRSEVARLEKALDLPPVPGYRTETARVAQRDFSGWWQRLVIDKGRDRGIPEGAPVIFAGGLVGRVSQVHAYMSEVELVGSPGFRIAAVFADDADARPMSYQGGGSMAFGPAFGTLEYVPLDATATDSQPARALTSGLGGFFPPGLAIGRVSKVNPSADGLFKTAEVQLDPRLSELAEVAVLVPLPIR